MIAQFRSTRARVLQILGAFSMYRLVVLALAVLFLCAIVLSLLGQVAYSGFELVASLAALSAGLFAADAVLHRVTHTALRWESSAITALILLFVMRPTLEAVPLLMLVVTGVVAAASKFVLVWRSRHVFNPAALAAAVMTIASLSPASWWVGTAALAPIVALLGIVVAWRTETLRIALTFVVFALALSIVTSLAAYAQAGLDVAFSDLALQLLTSSPILFLGFFMLTEPLTLPPRRWQQFATAAVVAFFIGFPVMIGDISLGSDRALLIGNLVAFALAFRTRHATKLELVSVRELTSRTREVHLRAGAALSFTAGQYLELTVPHRADQRGTRREFSLVSAPADLPDVRIAYRVAPERGSSFKRALGATAAGTTLSATGIYGDFVLPASGKVLLIAAGIGVTPFVSHVRQLRATGARDIVLVYVATDSAELAYRDEFREVPVVIFTPDDPRAADNETWAGGERISAAGLLVQVPDLADRHALISGPPALIADLAPTLKGAASVKTDAFAGY